MPIKKQVQDILPGKRRSMNETAAADAKIPPKLPRETKKPVDRGIRVPIHLDHTPQVSHAEPKVSSPKKPSSKNKRISNKKLIIGAIVLACGLIIAYVSSDFLARAKVTMTPRSLTIPISGTFEATRNAVSPRLPFETISTSTVAQMYVSASSGAAINAFATGMAMLINASSPSSQKILAGTRLTDSRGLVFKTVSTVIIPAATPKSAGTVAVRIIASAPGLDYNLSLTSLKGDLSITAWQGTPKARVFYGAMTTNITGGYSGLRMYVATGTLSSAAAALSSKLSIAAQDAIQSIIPSGYILYPNATKVVFSSTTVASTGSTTASVSMNATVTGIYFNKNDLVNQLAKNEIAQFPADNYEVNGLDSLVFATPSGQKLSFATSSIKFDLSGALQIIGVIDAAAVKGKLQGLPLSKSNTVFSQYNSVISGAEVSIVPFWIRTIPSSPGRISVVVATSTASRGN